jgi:hypothetical protein
MQIELFQMLFLSTVSNTAYLLLIYIYNFVELLLCAPLTFRRSYIFQSNSYFLGHMIHIIQLKQQDFFLPYPVCMSICCYCVGNDLKLCLYADH